jgi:hypothetical protein
VVFDRVSCIFNPFAVDTAYFLGVKFHLRSSHKLGYLHRFQEMATDGHYAFTNSFLYNIYIII